MSVHKPGRSNAGRSNPTCILMAEEVTADIVHDESTPTPLAFTSKRHLEKIEGLKMLAHSWRTKERMKTVSVALVLCLNVGVDPPDVVKTQPCARLECWIDPLSMSPQKALEAVGTALQRQYERWQPRARYKQSLDPTVDDVKKLCTSLRRNAKEERVLFHYTGHGVPKPTTNGEIWVFNKTYTQYIPLSVYDLQTWMGSPSIYVYDCSNAGVIVDSFEQFSEQRESELATLKSGKRVEGMSSTMSPPMSVKDCVQLASCGKDELLPMNPELPADLFTACLTTPIKVALRWFVLQNTHKLVPNITLELIDKIPGQLNDRRTMLGELNWIFTAITDTIAWNILPRDLFQRLFRQDLLVASLFRNFLLAERVMRSYNCTPVSSPKLPPTYQQSMWQAWDLALDLCLSQLPDILEERTTFQHSAFFAEQLTAFQVWLEYGSDKRAPPEQLPIVLQVLLSQVHRLRALDLLGRFLDLGPWAVLLALSVGIFPYVLKLLQASARELRPLLVFIWAKILAVDRSCQMDLVKENGHKYFLQLLQDTTMSAEQRTMAAFILAMIVNDHPAGQEAALKGNLIAICLEHLQDPNPLLRQWLALCLAKAWHNYDAARWCGVRDSAHEKLDQLLTDDVPEVRASAVFALGTYINTNTQERSDHSNNIDHSVARLLLKLTNDGSPLVRAELVVALSRFVQQFEREFSTLASQLQEEETWSMVNRSETVSGVAAFNRSGDLGGMRRSSSQRSLKGMLSPTQPSATTSNLLNVNSGGSYENVSVERTAAAAGMTRVASTSSLSGMMLGGYNTVYANVWKALKQFQADPYSSVSDMARKLIMHIKSNISAAIPKQMVGRKSSQPHSAPSSPSNKSVGAGLEHHQLGESPKDKSPVSAHSSVYGTSRRMFDKGTRVPQPVQEESQDSENGENDPPKRPSLLSTELFDWSCRHFAQSARCLKDDPQSLHNLEQDYRRARARTMQRAAGVEQKKAAKVRAMEQIFIKGNQAVPMTLKFHPYEPHLLAGDKEGGLSVWDWEQGIRLNYFHNKSTRHYKVSSMEFINAEDKALLLTGSDDGGVRVWRNYYNDMGGTPELVSAWQALADTLPAPKCEFLPKNSTSKFQSELSAHHPTSGLVLEWEQSTHVLYTAGDAKVIRLWDMNTETKLQDIPTGADGGVTSMAVDVFGRGLLVAGCGDGSVRLFDKRLPPSESRVMTYHEHNNWVVKVKIPHCGNGKIISGATPGDVRFWDCKVGESFKTIKALSGCVTAMDVHSQCPVIACGTSSQLIDLFTHSGERLSTIKYHDGFMGQRIGLISSLAFHPNRFKLAAGSVDSFVSVYSNPDSKRR